MMSPLYRILNLNHTSLKEEKVFHQTNSAQARIGKASMFHKRQYYLYPVLHLNIRKDRRHGFLKYASLILLLSSLLFLQDYKQWFGGFYQDEKNFFPQFAVYKETWLLYNLIRL